MGAPVYKLWGFSTGQIPVSNFTIGIDTIETVLLYHVVLGDPIDSDLWSRNDPLALAREVDPGALPALYLDCGEQGRYGLSRGHRALGRALDERGAKHQLRLPPGDHGYEFVRGRLGASLGFLSAALRSSR